MSDICVRSYRQISYRGNMMSYHVTGKSTVIGMSNAMNVMHTDLVNKILRSYMICRLQEVTNTLILRTY